METLERFFLVPLVSFEIFNIVKFETLKSGWCLSYFTVTSHDLSLLSIDSYYNYTVSWISYPSLTPSSLLFALVTSITLFTYLWCMTKNVVNVRSPPYLSPLDKYLTNGTRFGARLMGRSQWSKSEDEFFLNTRVKSLLLCLYSPQLVWFSHLPCLSLT